MKVTISTPIGEQPLSSSSPVLPQETGIAPKLIKKQELAEALNVSPRTIDEWTKRRMIPHLAISARLHLYDLDEVLAVLKKNYKIEAIETPPYR